MEVNVAFSSIDIDCSLVGSKIPEVNEWANNREGCVVCGVDASPRSFFANTVLFIPRVDAFTVAMTFCAGYWYVTCVETKDAYLIPFMLLT